MANSSITSWNDEIIQAHRISSLVLLGLFCLVSVVLGSLSVLNGWRLLNTTGGLRPLTFPKVKSWIINLVFIGSLISPIFSRFFRSSLDFKYFMGLISEDLVYHKVIIPQSITMTIYAISIFGTSMSLPITLIIFKYSTKIQAYHPTVTKVRIILAITLLHLVVDIPSLVCEYFFVDKYITSSPDIYVPMKSILAVFENVFAVISIIMVEVKSQTLQQLATAERVMIMRFAFGGLILYLIANTARCTLTCLQIWDWQIIPVGCVKALKHSNETYLATPFEHECLNYAELALMTATALAALVAIIVLASNLVLYQRLNNYREMHNSNRTNQHGRNSSDFTGNGSIPVNT